MICIAFSPDHFHASISLFQVKLLILTIFHELYLLNVQCLIWKKQTVLGRDDSSHQSPRYVMQSDNFHSEYF